MKRMGLCFLMFLLSVLVVSLSCSRTPKAKDKSVSLKTKIAHGKYLVTLGGCNDCHSPKVMTPRGPEPDSSRLLSGHPAKEKIPPADPKMISSGNWILAGKDFTSYVGPWGISYASNLTPDSATGLARWNVRTFIKTIRSGKKMGVGRPLLPPMPWQALSKLSNQDLTDIFLYLKSLKPVSNSVPDPIPPNQVSSALKQ